ncbi:MAG: hypothetical protein HRU20_30205 [Pseudomonadales bacterium]|nr:hypothetical protein [Pseudomonadales bacterium]
MINFPRFVLTLLLVFSFASITSSNAASSVPKALQFENAGFYDENGEFLPEKAKDAIMTMLKYHGYPVFDGMRKKMFAVDYNTGRFTEVGISGVMYENSQTHMYFLLDFFLLPGQMVAEHYHIDGETSAAKREGWLVRWGQSYIGGIGDDNMADYSNLIIPKIHWNGKVDARHVVDAKPGMFTNMAQVLSKHWMMAGNEGAIITEVANYSDSKTSIRSDPKMN